MMKNVYYLGAMQIQPDNFELNVQYQNDTTGVYLNYITEGNIKNKLLLKVMNLDRLDSRNEVRPDGKFDFVEGYTMSSSLGRVIFPVVEHIVRPRMRACGVDRRIIRLKLVLAWSVPLLTSVGIKLCELFCNRVVPRDVSTVAFP